MQKIDSWGNCYVSIMGLTVFIDEERLEFKVLLVKNSSWVGMSKSDFLNLTILFPYRSSY